MVQVHTAKDYGTKGRREWQIHFLPGIHTIPCPGVPAGACCSLLSLGSESFRHAKANAAIVPNCLVPTLQLC